MGAKAIMSLKHLNLLELIPSIRVMKKVQFEGVDTKEDSTLPVMIDDLFKFEMEKFMIKLKLWNTQ